MARVMVLLSVAALTAGCAAGPGAGGSSQSAQAQGPVDGITINCSGADAGWVFCYRNAREVCGIAGYTIVRRSDQAPAAAGSDTRTMVVRCN